MILRGLIHTVLCVSYMGNAEAGMDGVRACEVA